MQQVLVLHGPNLNLLGSREPAVYGTRTLQQINDTLNSQAVNLGVKLDCKQTNSEAQLVDWVQQARQENYACIILNAAGLTHTSVILRDALLAVSIPFIEVHLSNIQQREDFRRHSFLSDIASGCICGFGPLSYELALIAAVDILKKEK